MQMLRSNHTVTTILLACTHLSIALQHIPESTDNLKARAAGLDNQITNLKNSQKSVEDALLNQAKPRFLVKLRNYQADEMIRSLSKHLDAAGFGRKSDLWKAVFPDQLAAAMRPTSDGQLTVLSHIKTILTSRASVWADSAAWIDKISNTHTALQAAIKERQDGLLQIKGFRDQRNQSKQALITEYARLAGAIKEAFPVDKNLQEVFFDKLDTSTGIAADEADTSNNTDTPASNGDTPASPAPAPSI